MDELTRERFGPVVPYAEAHARPTPIWRSRTSDEDKHARRIDLCGTGDLTVQQSGGHIPGMRRHRRLIDAIRRYASTASQPDENLRGS